MIPMAGGWVCARCVALQELLARAQKERDEIAYRVEHPELAHLHYEGCPFKPWADVYDGDIPDPRPECTCGEAAKGAYWKGQHLLERARHDVTKADLRACAEALTKLRTSVALACDDDSDKFLDHRERLEKLVDDATDALNRPSLRESLLT